MKKQIGRWGQYLLICLLLLSMISVPVFAIVLFSSFVVSETETETGTLSEEDLGFTVTTEETPLVFTAAGDAHDITLTVSNPYGLDLTYSYDIAVVGAQPAPPASAEAALYAAILVYYDGEFAGTLSDFAAGGTLQSEKFVMAGTDGAPATDTHTLTLEMHIDAPAEYLGQTVTLKTTVCTQNANRQKYLFAQDEASFRRAVDDINSGLLTDPVIVLSADTALTGAHELRQAAGIDLNGHHLQFDGGTLTLTAGVSRLYSSSQLPDATVTGANGASIVLNGESALLDIADMYVTEGETRVNAGSRYGALVSLSAYETAGADALLEERIGGALNDGVAAGSSTDLFGAVGFYAGGKSVTVTGNCTYAGGVLTAGTGDVTTLASVRAEGCDPIEFRIIGTGDDALFAALLAQELRHIPNTIESSEAVTSNLFLPTASKSKNATIRWTSSREDILSSSGVIAETVPDGTLVTLFAEITVNESVYTTTYTFRVSSQNNETRFSYFVNQLSPISLKHVYDGTDTSQNMQNTAFFHLPVVDPNSDYDYRKDYKTTVNGQYYSWTAFNNMGLTRVWYEPINTYNYITVEPDGNDYSVYLNMATFKTFAQIRVFGTFAGDDEVYESVVKIDIELGRDTDLYNLAFTYAAEELAAVDVLQNILDTRMLYGMQGERGDFYAEAVYMTFFLGYEIPASSADIITSVEGVGEDGATVLTTTYNKATGANDTVYHFSLSATETAGLSTDEITQLYSSRAAELTKRYILHLSPEHFYSSDTGIALTVRVRHLEDVKEGLSGQSRMLYFTAPGVLRADSAGFLEEDVFLSVKYQAFQQLPAEGRTLCVAASTTTDPAASIAGGVYTDPATGVQTPVYTVNGADDLAYSLRIAALPPVADPTYRTGFTVTGGTVHSDNAPYLLVHDLQYITSLTLPIATDTEAAENDAQAKVLVFAKLLDHVTGAEKKTATFTVGTTSVTCTSDGKEFLNPDELAAVQTLFRFISGYSDTEWDALWSSLSEQALGFVIADGAPMNAAINSILTNPSYSPGSFAGESTAGCYFKYTEILEWATDKKEFANQDVASYYRKCAPNSGVLNKEAWNITLTLDNYMTADPTTWTRVSNDYRYQRNSFYYDDDEETISVGEAQTIIAYWYNAYGSYNQTIGRTFATAFLQSIAVPTYLRAGAVGTLISTLYDALGVNPGHMTLSYRTVNGKLCPVVVNLDDSLTALARFGVTALSDFRVLGDTTGNAAGQPAFLTNAALQAAYNRVTTQCPGVSHLVMRNCAKGHNSFDFSNGYRLGDLAYLDLSYNSGITSIGNLTDFDLTKIGYIDIHGASATERFMEYTLQSAYVLYRRANGAAPDIYYTHEGIRTRYETDVTDISEELTFLNEIGDIRANYLQLCQKVYAEDGTSLQLIWHIEEGNPMYLVTAAGDAPQISTAEEMLGKILRYCYCTESFTYGGQSFVAGHLYGMSYTGGDLQFIDQGAYDSQPTPPSYTPTPGYTYTATGTPTLTSGPTQESSSSTTNTVTVIPGRRWSATDITVKQSDGTTATERVNGLRYTSFVAYRYTRTYTGSADVAIDYTNGTDVTYYYDEATERIYEATYTYVSKGVATTTYECTYSCEIRVYVMERYTRTDWSWTWSAYNPGSAIIYDGKTYNLLLDTDTLPTLTTDDINSGIDGLTVEWQEPTGLTGSWGTPTVTTYYSPVGEIASTGITYPPAATGDPITLDALNAFADTVAEGYSYYRYTGATVTGLSTVAAGTETPHSYTNNDYCRLGVGSDGFFWKTGVGTTLTGAGGAGSLDDLLNTANTAIQTDPSRQGEWYGNYYYYTGSTFRTSSGMLYERGHVYRMMMGDDGNFYYQYGEGALGTRATCTSVSTGAELLEAMFNGEDNLGKVYYLTSRGGDGQWYYGGGQGEIGIGFFEIVYDEASGAYTTRTFGTSAILYGAQYDKMENRRCINSDDPDYYSGTGGTGNLVISATVVVDGKEYTRLFESSMTA